MPDSFKVALRNNLETIDTTEDSIKSKRWRGSVVAPCATARSRAEPLLHSYSTVTDSGKISCSV